MVKLNRIYTRTGDAGATGLVDGSRVSKASARIAAIGEVDEVNSAIGGAIAALGEHRGLARIQNDLFDLGADLATPGDDFAATDIALRIVPDQVTRLEVEIDALNDALPPLTSFVLPGGNAAIAAVHLARAIARRAERAIAHAAEVASINPEALRYVNRLSDYLFVLARSLAVHGPGEVLWVPGGSRDGKE